MLRIRSIALLLVAGAAGAQAQVRLAVADGPVSLPIYVAQDLGLFEREKVEARVQVCANGRECVRLLHEGKADLATASEFVVTLGIRQHPDDTILAVMSSSTQHIKLVARTDAGISTPESLRRKRVGTAAGTSAQFYLDAWLTYHGLERADVQIQALPPDRLVAALSAGTVDAVAAWEPAAGQARAALGDQALVMPNPRVYTQHMVLMSSRGEIDRSRADFQKVLRALARASHVIAEDPATARRVLARHVPGANVDLGEHDFALRMSQSLIATMESQVRWARREKLAQPGDRGVLQSLDSSVLREVVPAAVAVGR